jgi:streptomycin 6-kinase
VNVLAVQAVQLHKRLYVGLLDGLPVIELSDSFKRTVLGYFANGATWLASLPKSLTECEKRWQIQIGPPFKLSYNYVAPAITTNGKEVVIKICIPSPEFRLEIEALHLYAGQAAVRLLRFDEDRGFLLMERLRPGQTLLSLTNDELAIRAAARVMRELWRPLPSSHSFPTIEKWAGGLNKLRSRFQGGTGPFPSHLVEMAESLFSELIASSEPPVLLHGDLHYTNILSAHRRPWVAIDPKGLAGERAYEVGVLLRNPNPSLCTDLEVQRRRIGVLRDELMLDSHRIVRWGVAQAVLSAWWSFEVYGSGWESGCACAEVLARLMR